METTHPRSFYTFIIYILQKNYTTFEGGLDSIFEEGALSFFCIHISANLSNLYKVALSMASTSSSSSSFVS